MVDEPGTFFKEEKENGLCAKHVRGGNPCILLNDAKMG